MLAAQLDSEIVGLHVRDPYLKQFQTEIYAQGRLEYLDHVDQCLASDAEEATSAFGILATGANVRWRVKTVDGEPIEQITREAETGDYALLILGRRPRKGFAAWRSRDLPGKILAAVSVPPIMLVPADRTRGLQTPRSLEGEG